MREYQNQHYSPIFIITSAKIDISELLELNVQYYLMKPFKYQKIFELLNLAYHEIYPMEISLTSGVQLNICKKHKFIEKLKNLIKNKFSDC